MPLLAAVGAPSLSEPRFAPKPARRRAANDSAVARAPAPVAPPVVAAAALPLNIVPRKPGAIWLLVAVVAAAILLVIVLRTITSGQRSEETTAASDTPAVSVLPVPALPAQPEGAPSPILVEPSTKALPAKAPRKAVRIETPAPAVIAPPPAPEPVPVARAPVPTPRAVEAPRADPWQALNEGLSGCARQGLLDRMACEQRLRSQYCGNSWGVAPQCPIGTATDHGQ